MALETRMVFYMNNFLISVFEIILIDIKQKLENDNVLKIQDS
jgi:hypothetical protein